MAADLLRHNSHRLSFGRHIKLFSDGAFFSQLAQMQEPGYIDGHHGEWLAAPEELERHIRAYWLRAIRFMCMSPAILVWS